LQQQLEAINNELACLQELEERNFIGFFNSLVHDDESLSNVEKFNHLLSCLEKEALGTVKATRKILANAMIIHIVMSRVDLKTRSRWEEQLSYDSIPLWKVCSEALN